MALEEQSKNAAVRIEPSPASGSDSSAESPEEQLTREGLLETRDRIAARRKLTSRSDYDSELAYWIGFVRRYGFTLALAAACIVVYVAELALAGSTDIGSIVFADIPNDVLYQMGGLVPPLVQWPDDWFRFVASNFLHGNAVHLLGNVLVLLFAGHVVELGAKKAGFALVVAASGLASSVAAYWYGMVPGVDTFISIGASGIAYGMVGAGFMMLALHREHTKPFGIHCIFLYLCAFYELPSLLVSLAFPDMIEVEHIAGLLGGAIAMLAAPCRDLRAAVAVRIVAGAGLVAFFAAFFATNGSLAFG